MKSPLTDRTYLLEKFPGKGGWTYAIIPEIKPDPHAWFGWVNVRGSIDEVELPRTKLMPMGNGKLFLPVNAALRKKLKKQAGDTVHIQLYPADEPPVLPQEIRECFDFEPPEVLQCFNALSADQQYALLNPVLAAKQPDSKVRKIREMMDELRRQIKM